MSAPEDFDPFGPEQPSIPAVSWKGLPVGTVKTLTVTGPHSIVQERVYATKELATWKDGKPKMAVVLPVTENGEPRNLWVTVVNSKGSSYLRFLAAFRPDAPASGDVLAVKLIDQVDVGKGNPRNDFDYSAKRAPKPAASDPFAAADPWASGIDEAPF